MVDERRPRKRRLDVMQVEQAERRAASVAEFLDHDVDRLADPRNDRGARLHTRVTVIVNENVGVCVRQREPSLGGGLGHVIDLDDAGDRLLLEPLLRIPLGDACASGEISWRYRSGAGQLLVQAEPDAKLDICEFHRRQAGHEQLPRKLLDLGLVVARQLDSRHRSSTPVIALSSGSSHRWPPRDRCQAGWNRAMVLPSGSVNHADRPMGEVTTWSTVLKVAVSYSLNSMPFSASCSTSLATSAVQNRTWVWSALLPLGRP